MLPFGPAMNFTLLGKKRLSIGAHMLLFSQAIIVYALVGRLGKRVSDRYVLGILG